MRYIIFNNPCFEVNAAAEISQTKAQDVICEQENFPFHAGKSIFHNFQLHSHKDAQNCLNHWKIKDVRQR